MATRVNVKFPNEIAGLLAWWDAVDFNGLADNTSISTWQDKSGNGYHFVNTSSPSVKKTGPSGNAVLSGSGAYHAAVNLYSQMPFTMFCVHKKNHATFAVVFSSFEGNNNFILSNSSLLQNSGTTNMAGAGDLVNTYMLTVVASNTASQRIVRMNSVPYTPVANVISAISGLSLNFRNSFGNIGINDLSEIIIFNRPLLLSEISLVERYLRFKWKL